MRIIIAAIFILSSVYVQSQKTIVYKQFDSFQLNMDIYYPPNMKKEKVYPSIIFYYGGGWSGDDRSHFAYYASYYAKKGFVCIIPEYRTLSNHNATPFESLMDAKSVMRYVRKNASELKIDADRIIASGSSAGGRLATSLSTIRRYNDKNDDLSVSCEPNALILFNPIINYGSPSSGIDGTMNKYRDFSPLHNLHKDMPPTIYFQGTKDKIAKVETAEYYKKTIEKMNGFCELKIFENAKHGFFNTSKFRKQCLTSIDAF
ncbi:MAG: alpha/beta hydrolase, partial [Saprospiraceae bacterium]|nr:alpha/beta hydrolase [Saprospiraceae bacterium]